jgi:hypothetical protein
MCCKCHVPHSESAHGKIGIYNLSQLRQSLGTFDLCKDEVNDQPDRPQSGLLSIFAWRRVIAAGARHECCPALQEVFINGSASRRIRVARSAFQPRCVAAKILRVTTAGVILDSLGAITPFHIAER